MVAALALLKTFWGVLSKIPWYIYVAIALVVYHFAAIRYYEGQARDECNAAWQKKEAAAEAAYQASLAQATQANADTKAKWKAKLSQVGVEYANALQEQADLRARDVAAAKSGALKLRYRPNSVQAGHPSSPQAPGPSAPSNDPGARELPPEIAANLYALADDADQVARQLAACQAVVSADRQ